MASTLSDVSPEIASRITRHWRETPLWRKLAYVNELNQTLKILAISDLRRRYPNDSNAQLQRRLATRWLGVELADRVYGPINEQPDAALRGAPPPKLTSTDDDPQQMRLDI